MEGKNWGASRGWPAPIERNCYFALALTTRKSSITEAFGQWHKKWEGYLNEKMEEASRETYYTHKPLRNTYLSIMRNLLY